MTSLKKPRIGISACLLGQPVRYDGGHKLDAFLRDTWGLYLELVPVCPEQECGLPVPREPMQLEGDPARPRLVTTGSRRDLTAQLESWAARKLEQLAGLELDGYIFKSKSPSCGVERVKVYDAAGLPHKVGSGLFVRMFSRRFPLLPLAEEGRLSDVDLRENFIKRLFVLRRWRELLAGGLTVGKLLAFHADHELLLLAHSPAHCRRLGRLVAQAKGRRRRELEASYQRELLQALTLRATRAKQAKVLQQLRGHLKKQLGAGERQELDGLIEHYRAGHLPLLVPLTLIEHYARQHGDPYLARQVYLHPHPLELALRNHP